ncbi:MAG: T9SS type A sorting domain-containing protein, partial [Bacteroidetes bacterium]|nr:T9SS type A sorting domain-containing protein [Bacteroidota bacterium]
RSQVTTDDEWVKIDIVNIQGSVVQTPIDKKLMKETHTIVLDLNDLAAGTYMVNVFKKSGNSSTKFQRVR